MYNKNLEMNFVLDLRAHKKKLSKSFFQPLEWHYPLILYISFINRHRII